VVGRRVKGSALVAVLFAVIPLGLAAQRGGGWFGFGSRYDQLPNVRYDGRLVLARIRYRGYGSWDYDYPTMERNLSTMLKELTAIDVHLGESNVHSLDDPELLKFPVAYLTEPGYWFPTDSEVLGLRQYIEKGGFLIVDDFHFAPEWQVFESAMMRVLPKAQIEPLDISHPVFNSFFEIKTLKVPYPGGLGESGLMGEFYGIHEDNDPTKRLMVVINYNMDIGDYMEWSATNAYNPLPTNEAYKFGINYIIYGLTH
jgi:Domain of unknown function (DUF4159)